MRRRDLRYIGPWRPATKDDVMLSLGPAAKATPPAELRASHERILVKYALGYTYVEIAEQTGYTPQRVSTICTAPAAQDRIARIREKVIEEEIRRELDSEHAVRDIETQTARLLAHIEYDQVVQAEAKGEFIPWRDLRARIGDWNDRYGTPRKSTNVNVNADFGSKLEEAIARSDALRSVEGTTITDPRSIN